MQSNLTNHINQSQNLGLYQQKVGTKSVHSRYTVSGILKSLKNKKASKQSALKLFLSWRWDSNPRPADYKSAALPTELRQQILISF